MGSEIKFLPGLSKVLALFWQEKMELFLLVVPWPVSSVGNEDPEKTLKVGRA